MCKRRKKIDVSHYKNLWVDFEKVCEPLYLAAVCQDGIDPDDLKRYFDWRTKVYTEFMALAYEKGSN